MVSRLHRIALLVILTGGLLGAVVLLPALASREAGKACTDATASAGTRVGEAVVGTSGPERLTTEDEPGATAVGLDGDDCLIGQGKDRGDVLVGGDGADEIDGAGGDDQIDGGRGADTITGDDGDDRLSGGTGEENFVDGGGGQDEIIGSGKGDLLIGGDDNDEISSTGSNANVVGGAGNDLIDTANFSNDTVDCGPGDNDSVRRNEGDTVHNCEFEYVLGIRKPGVMGG